MFPKKEDRKDREYYEEKLSQIDKKLLNYYVNVYKTLHLNGYYDGNTDVKIITEGFDLAYNIIEKIKP